MCFDKLLYDGGLAKLGTWKRKFQGRDRYTIKKYSDLDSLLGANWHWRGLNAAGDFCYVILNTVEFYIYQRRCLKEFLPMPSSHTQVTRDLGYSVVFSFVRGDGTPHQFGKDKSIFP